MHNLKELKIWQHSIELASNIYRITKMFPKEELYGLVSQIRRSAVSISSNIAEGAGRNSDKEFIYFLSIAHGSSFELQTQLIIAGNLGMISEIDLEQSLKAITESQKMNFKFQEMLKSRLNKNEKAN